MSIVSVVVTEDSGTAPRVLRFQLTDSTGATHEWGPMFTTPSFDVEAFKSVISAKIEDRLAETEAQQVLG